MIVRKAVIKDIENVYKLINFYANQELLLPRTILSLYENIQCIYVAEKDGKVVGAGSLHVLGKDLAEVRSLVISPEEKGKGIGTKIIEKIREDAGKLGVENLFSMTYQVGFFEKLGFTIVNKENYPAKIWKDCMNCPKFTNCDETMLIQKVYDTSSTYIL